MDIKDSWLKIALQEVTYNAIMFYKNTLQQDRKYIKYTIVRQKIYKVKYEENLRMARVYVQSKNLSTESLTV